MPTSRFIRVAAFATVAGLVPVSADAASRASTDDPRPRIRVTARDVEASNQKVAMAYSALVQMWTREFEQIGERFARPRVVRYEGGVLTACGPVGSSNAIYCQRDNSVYYDQVFVAAMQKVAGHSVGTDGDMAAIGIIAHEVGHAVAMQLGYRPRDSYANESTADCLAGAFAHQSRRDGSLEPGDVEEAVFGMSLAGDPTLEPTGNDRLDAIMEARLERSRHGTKQERMHNFRAGLDRGPEACLAAFR